MKHYKNRSDHSVTRQGSPRGIWHRAGHLVAIGGFAITGLASAHLPQLAMVPSTAAMSLIAQGRSVTFQSPPEDPCRPKSLPIFGWQPDVDHIVVNGGGVDIYTVPSVPSPVKLKKARPLAVIVNGNGFGLSQYEQLATHLASKGFLVAVAQRPTGDQAGFVLDVVQEVIQHQGQVSSTRVALIGHSRGGQVVTQAAVRNLEENVGLNIHAVVGLAPTLDEADTQLTREHVPAYLLIYGSQDQDVEGMSATDRGRICRLRSRRHRVHNHLQAWRHLLRQTRPRPDHGLSARRHARQPGQCERTVHGWPVQPGLQ